MKPVFLALFLAAAPLAFGQLDSGSVTVTAYRSSAVQPDEVLFGVFVDTATFTSLSDVTNALQAVGITIANFSNVSTVSQFNLPPGAPQPPALEWAFSLPVPIAKLKDTAAMLAALQVSIGQGNPGMTLSFSVQGTQASQQALQSFTCSNTDLIAAARAQAQDLASAAGQNLGSILAMSNGTNVFAPTRIAVVTRFNNFFNGPSQTGCSLTVKFALLLY